MISEKFSGGIILIKYENDCVDCGLPCMGKSCPMKDVPHFYCDECKDEKNLFHFEGEELCIECIENKLEKVGV